VRHILSVFFPPLFFFPSPPFFPFSRTELGVLEVWRKERNRTRGGLVPFPSPPLFPPSWQCQNTEAGNKGSKSYNSVKRFDLPSSLTPFSFSFSFPPFPSFLVSGLAMQLQRGSSNGILNEGRSGGTVGGVFFSFLFLPLPPPLFFFFFSFSLLAFFFNPACQARHEGVDGKGCLPLSNGQPSCPFHFFFFFFFFSFFPFFSLSLLAVLLKLEPKRRREGRTARVVGDRLSPFLFSLFLLDDEQESYSAKRRW